MPLDPFIATQLTVSSEETTFCLRLNLRIHFLFKKFA